MELSSRRSNDGRGRALGRGLTVLAFAGIAAAALSSRAYREDRTGRLLAHVFAARIDQELATNASPASFRAALADDGVLEVTDTALDGVFAALQRAGGPLDGRSRERAAHRLRPTARGVEVQDRFELVRFYAPASVVVTLEIRVGQGHPRLARISALEAPPFPWTDLDLDGFGLEPPLDAERESVLAAVCRHIVADLREHDELEPRGREPQPRVPSEIDCVLADDELPAWDDEPRPHGTIQRWRITVHSLRRLDATTYRAGVSLRGGPYGVSSQFVRVVRDGERWRVQARMELFVS